MKPMSDSKKNSPSGRLVKKITALSVSLAMVFQLSACSLYAPQVINNNLRTKISFSWWGGDERSEKTLQGISIFTDKYDISVVPEYAEFSGFKSRMDSEIFSDTECDVMQINYDWLYEYSADGEGFYDIYELDNFIDLSTYPEGSLECGEINGKLCAIPYSMNALTFVYNKTLYESYGLDIPKTWDDLFEAAKVMRCDEVYPLSLADKNFWMLCCAYEEQMTGKEVIDRDGKLCIGVDEFKLMLEFYLKLIEEKVSDRGSEFDRSDFGRLKIGGAVTWASDPGYYEDTANGIGMETVVGEYLTAENYKGFGWYIKPTGLYAIKKDTNYPVESAKLVDFLVNSSDMSMLMELTKGVPISNSAKETLEARSLLGGIEVKATQKLESTPELGVMSPYIENQAYIDIFTGVCESVYYDKVGIDAAAVTLYEKMSSIKH